MWSLGNDNNFYKKVIGVWGLGGVAPTGFSWRRVPAPTQYHLSNKKVSKMRIENYQYCQQKPRLTTTAVTVMTCYNKFAFIFNVPHLLSHSHSGDEIKKRKNEKGSSQRLIFNKIVVPSHDNIEVKRRWWRNIENWLYYAIFVLFHVENSNTIKLLEIKTPDTLWDLTRKL